MGNQQSLGMFNQPFWGIILRWGGLLFLGLLVGASLGYVFVDKVRNSPGETFESEALTRVRYAVSPSGVVSELSGSVLAQEIAVLTLKLKSTELLESVVQELPSDWNLTPSELFSRITVRGQQSPLPGFPKIKVAPGVPVPGISIPTLSIRVTDQDPVRAQLLANTMAMVLVQTALEDNQRTSANLAHQSSLELQLLETSLAAALVARNQLIAGQSTDAVASAVTDPNLEIADVRVNALLTTYQGQVQNLGSARFKTAKLGPPLTLIQNAPLGISNPPAIRKREAMAIGGVGGMVLVWVVVNLIDSIRNAGQQTAPGSRRETAVTAEEVPSPNL